jgi:hypothetical protein
LLDRESIGFEELLLDTHHGFPRQHQLEHHLHSRRRELGHLEFFL